MFIPLPDWHYMRRSGLSSSDLAAIAKRSEYRSPRMVQREKLHPAERPAKREVSEDMEWGNIMEPYVVARACKKLGLALIPPDEWASVLGRTVLKCADGNAIKWMVFCPQWDIARSTPDNIARTREGDLVLIEAKTTGVWRKWAKGVPRGVWWQVQWHLLVTGLKRAIVPVLFFGRTRKLEMFTVDLHPAFAGENPKALDVGRRWWDKHVVAKETCPPTGLDIPDQDREFAKTDGSTVALPLTYAKLYSTYADLKTIETGQKAKLKTITDEIREVEAQFRDGIGKAMFATIDGKPGVTYRLFTDRHGKRRLSRKEKPACPR